MRKLLVITYYWPPSGGAGVQRWLKFVKYLRDFGWEPVVYTAEGGEAPSIDHSLAKDIPKGITVIKHPIWEPYSIYKKMVGQKKEDRINTGFLSEKKKPPVTESLAVWIRGNFFIPDARKFWIKPSVKFLVKYLKEYPVDAIASTGPPHSMHMIALGVKKKLGVKWLADFRDPWTFIDFYDDLKLTKSADRKHRYMEKQVLENADAIVTVSDNWAKGFAALCNKQVDVVTNGFDKADYEGIQAELDKRFTISHIGSLNKDRNSEVFWQAVREVCDEHQDFRSDVVLKFVGKTDHAVFDSLEHLGLNELAEKVDYVPHEEVIKIMMQSQVLLLLINNAPNAMGIIPGKVFEYIGSRRPILCIGRLDGDSAKLVTSSGTGTSIAFENKEGMKKALIGMYQDYKAGKESSNNQDTEKFSRKVKTSELSGILNRLAG